MASTLILSDGSLRGPLLPFTFMRPVATMRLGILTIAEKWQHYLGQEPQLYGADYLRTKFPVNPGKDNLIILGGLLPDTELVKAVQNLQSGEALVRDNQVLALRREGEDITLSAEGFKSKSYEGKAKIVSRLWHIFEWCGEELEKDFELLTKGRDSQPLSLSNRTIGEGKIFLEEGAIVEGAILNATSGPIYIGKDAEIMEGSLVRGPFALGEHSQLKLGAKIYGPTSIGPWCKVGGEVNNSVFQGFSNKAHDGFVGNSVIGEWCNIGADSNNSNLKNNYEEVKIWSYEQGGFESTGLQFCGLFLGDHSKCGINTMFNTGTVVGVSANIFGGGFPRTFIPSFSWGGAGGITTYRLDKALETAGRVFARRKLELLEADRQIFEHVFEETSPNRKG